MQGTVKTGYTRTKLSERERHTLPVENIKKEKLYKRRLYTKDGRNFGNGWSRSHENEDLIFVKIDGKERTEIFTYSEIIDNFYLGEFKK